MLSPTNKDNMKIIIAIKIVETIAIPKAPNHPVSKKCFIKPNHAIRVIIKLKLGKKFIKTMLIIVPRKVIKKASLNLAFFSPTVLRPTIQRTKVIKKILAIKANIQ